MKAILVVETVMLIGLLGSYLGARSKIKGLEMLLETYKQIAKSREHIALWEKSKKNESNISD